MAFFKFALDLFFVSFLFKVGSNEEMAADDRKQALKLLEKEKQKEAKLFNEYNLQVTCLTAADEKLAA